MSTQIDRNQATMVSYPINTLKNKDSSMASQNCGTSVHNQVSVAAAGHDIVSYKGPMKNASGSFVTT